MNMSEKIKEKTLTDFVKKWEHLPPQRSSQWLADRKFTIGGSEMGTITGYNPFKNIRGLIEDHLGITSFSGNINTYWGTIGEDLVIKILEKQWGCKIYETASLPGVVEGQKYSPDGLAYLSFFDKIVLLEIKCAARRVANGKIPRMYKPQIFTGLDTISIAEMGMFVDALFRCCSLTDWVFTPTYNTDMHPDKQLGEPMGLYMICMYEKTQSSSYDEIKASYGKKKDGWVDIGSCNISTIEKILCDAATGKLEIFSPNTTSDPETAIAEINHFFESNNYKPVAIMPLKLFKMDIIPVQCDDWKKEYNRKTKKWEISKSGSSFVKQYETIIKTTISHIKRLDTLPQDQQKAEIDLIFSKSDK
jgi:hypothetical protein